MGEPFSITTVTTTDDFKTKLKDTKVTNLNCIATSYVNINSIIKKFELLDKAVMGNVDILMVTETKFDEYLPTSQFFYTWFYFTIPF